FFQAEDGIRDSSVTGVQTCSSDLIGILAQRLERVERAGCDLLGEKGAHLLAQFLAFGRQTDRIETERGHRLSFSFRFSVMRPGEIGRASCRERVWLVRGAVSGHET